jgi:hypothetical protein
MTNSAAAAEDIAQDVFLLFLRHPDRFMAPRSHEGGHLGGHDTDFLKATMNLFPHNPE